MARHSQPDKQNAGLVYYAKAAARLADQARPPVELPKEAFDWKMAVARLKAKYAKPMREGTT